MTVLRYFSNKKIMIKIGIFLKISGIDEIFLLKTFLNYLEIFLNEFRKYLFAKGEIEHEDEPSQMVFSL